MSRTIRLSLLLAIALLALAPAAASAQAAPRATKAAVVAPQPTASAPVQRPPLTAEEKALRAVEEDGRIQVEALVKSMQGLPDGPALRALERKVEDVKKASRVGFLRVKVQFARQRGDLAGAQEAQRQIELILNPPKPALAPIAPASRERIEKEGGQP